MNRLILLIKTVVDYENAIGRKAYTMSEIHNWCESNDMIIGASLLQEYL